MSRWDSIGLLWQDIDTTRKGGKRELGPIPPWDDTGWKPPVDFPNIQHAKAISLDCETYDPNLQTTGPGWGKGESHIVGVSLAVDGGKWYFPMKHEVEPELNMDSAQVLKFVTWALSGTTNVKIGANIIYDVGHLMAEGVEVPGQLYDVQIAESLIHEQSRLSLDNLGWKYLGTGKTTDVLKEWAQNYYGTGERSWRKDIYRCPTSLVGHYAEDDAAMPLEILKKQWPLLTQHSLLDLLHMECKLIRLLISMRMEGVHVDIPYAEELREKFVDKEKELQKKLNYIAGVDLNINSGDSIAVAFENHGIQYPRTNPTTNFPDGKPSFVKEFLEKHPHKLPKLITELRGVTKLRGTFVEGYLLNSHIKGKIHCEFLLTGTEFGGAKTGRMASANPNLQNIPIRTEEGQLIRNAFVPDVGHECWRKYDLSQIEYRMLAHFATGKGAADLQALYNRDPSVDFHQMASDLIFKVTGIRLSRNDTKSINFGFVYGLGKVALANDLGVTLEKAKQLAEDYHKGAPFVRETMDSIMNATSQTGIVETILGRRSHFDLWEPANWGARDVALPLDQAREEWGDDIIRAFTYRAVNYKFQGSAADQLKASLAKAMDAGIFDVIGVPRLLVHDEVDFSDPGGVDEAYDEFKHIMETSIPLKVPVYCDYEAGRSWGEVQEVT